jgi:hypothetical protein
MVFFLGLGVDDNIIISVVWRGGRWGRSGRDSGGAGVLCGPGVGGTGGSGKFAAVSGAGPFKHKAPEYIIEQVNPYDGKNDTDQSGQQAHTEYQDDDADEDRESG